MALKGIVQRQRLFIIRKTEKNIYDLSLKDFVNNSWYIYTMEYYLNTKMVMQNRIINIERCFQYMKLEKTWSS